MGGVREGGRIKMAVTIFILYFLVIAHNRYFLLLFPPVSPAPPPPLISSLDAESDPYPHTTTAPPCMYVRLSFLSW